MKLIITTTALLFAANAFCQTQPAKVTQEKTQSKEEIKNPKPIPANPQIAKEEKPEEIAAKTANTKTSSATDEMKPGKSIEIKPVEKKLVIKPGAVPSTIPATMERKTPAGVIQTEKEKQGQQVTNQ